MFRKAFKTFFSFTSPVLPTVEMWAEHNARKVSADSLIAATIVESFARDLKSWTLKGELNQKHTLKGIRAATESIVDPTTLIRRRVTKPNIDIEFAFIQTSSFDEEDKWSTTYLYEVMSCKVNGVQVDDEAFKLIYTSWKDIVAKVKRAEEVAAKALEEMKETQSKWDLVEKLMGYTRSPTGALVPVKENGK